MTTDPRARILAEAADAAQSTVRCQTHAEANGKQNTIDFLRQLAAEVPATRNPSVVTDRVLSEVLAERIAQDAKWGEQNHLDGTGVAPEQRELADNARAMCQQVFAEGRGDWAHVLFEEVREALAERDPAKLRAELLQVGAVAVAWIEAIDRRPTL
ncbi:NUDIX hydrolase [Streptomyces sp. NBC_00124]|uniref:NUDIX hydrolase n=1 Tax=Streptomyces sp. NBC_00124 TaxID=2975662 RepID=UPI0022579EDF|nr:NUDIX hydrolase [Streptomyces sp. NBC_00124]MCX5365884.1 NUDIX hydrolase [Streptomyces sp. NBC_00124]